MTYNIESKREKKHLLNTLGVRMLLLVSLPEVLPTSIQTSISWAHV